MFYVVGNGPSLRKSDLKNIPDNQWLGMNSAYRYWDTIGKYPKYYACLDPVVVKSHAKEILRLHRENLVEEFFLHQDILVEIPEFENDVRVCLLCDFLKDKSHKLGLSRFALYKQTTGALATRFCLEKGFDKLCLIGIDCNYVELIDEAKALDGYDLIIDKKVSSNPNYFFDDYQAQGDKYQVPNPKVHSGNLHLQSFIAIANQIKDTNESTRVFVGSTKSLLSKFNIFPTKPIRELMGLRRVECVAIPIIKNEVDSLLENFELWTKPKLSPCLYNYESGTVLHIFLDGTYDKSIYDTISIKLNQLPELKNFFSEFKITFLSLPDSINYYRKESKGKIEFCTKSGPNIFFLSVMKHCSQYEYTFQMESDCIPLKAGWLDGVNRLIKSDGENAWFHGPNYYGPTSIDSTYDLHINGNAIYATGNNSFQEFLGNEYLTLLKYIISSGVNHMAYDTVMSFIFSGNSENVKAATGIDLRRFLPRYRFSDFILNLGGGVETKDYSSVELLKLLNDNPNSYLGHGKLFQHLVPQNYEQLQSFYCLYDNNAELAFTSVWFNDQTIRSVSAGYGKLSFIDFPKSDVLVAINFNNLYWSNASSGLVNTFIRFSIASSNLNVNNAFIRLTDSNNMTEDVVCDVVFDNNNYTFKSTFNIEGEMAWENVALVFTSNRTGEEKNIEIDACSGIYKIDESFDAKLKNEEVYEDAQSLVEDWRVFVEEGNRYVKNQASQLKYSNFFSKHILLKNVKVINNTLSVQMIESKSLNNESDEPLAVISFSGCIPLQAKKIKFTSNPEATIKLRICRHGTNTSWEYSDAVIEGGSVEIDNPFNISHERMRIEIFSLSNSKSKNIYLQAEYFIDSCLPEQLVEPDKKIKLENTSELHCEVMKTSSFNSEYREVATKNNMELLQHLDFKEFKSLIKALELNDITTVSFLFKRQGVQFSDSLIKTLTKNEKWKWLLPVAVNSAKLTKPNMILPKLVYFDPVHRNTVSATQELRKKLLNRYPDILVTLVHPSWEKKGMWEVTTGGVTKYVSLDEIIADLAVLDNVKLIVRTGFLGQNGVDLYSKLVGLNCDIYSYIMDTWDLREQNSNGAISKKLLMSFRELLNESKGVISITNDMALHLENYYSINSNVIVHNFIADHDKQKMIKSVNGEANCSKKKQKRMYLYSGGLEEDMTYGGLQDFIRVIGADAALKSKVKLVVKTFKRHKEQALKIIEECKKAGLHYQVLAEDMSIKEYNKLVATADVFFIPYVKSKASEMYVKNSFPNKFGDYLCYQKPIIYFGPNYAISKIIKELDVNGIFSVDNNDALQRQIINIYNNYGLLSNDIVLARGKIINQFGERVHLSRFYNCIL